MKSIVLLCVIASSLGARAPGQLQPPRLPPARFRSQRFELIPTTESSAEPTTDSVGEPYPPSGWKPEGASFHLPDKKAATSAPYPPSGWTPPGKPFRLPQEQQPNSGYETPDDGAPTDVPTTDMPVTDTPESLQTEKIEGPVEVLKSVGTYFVILPGGRLQQVGAGGAGAPARLQLARLLSFGR